MKKRRVEYIILLIIFLIFLFADSLNLLWIKSDKILNAEILETTENKNLKEENEELKKVIDFNEKTDLDFIISKVKYRDIYDFKEEITIFKGKNQGLKEDMAVINEDGLIGVIKSVSDNSSIVRLITNQKSNVSVKINETYGLLKMQENTLVVSNITNYDNVKVGDEISTSGIGNLPGNFLIGTVKEITLDSLGIEKIVTVDLKPDIENLNYVYIVGEK